jgi:hypothetical protein
VQAVQRRRRSRAASAVRACAAAVVRRRRANRRVSDSSRLAAVTGRWQCLEAQRFGAGWLLVLLLPGGLSRLWRLVFAWRVHQPWAAESVSRLLRVLALGKADFACARGHRSRRCVEAASETTTGSGLSASKSSSATEVHVETQRADVYKQAPQSLRAERSCAAERDLAQSKGTADDVTDAP